MTRRTPAQFGLLATLCMASSLSVLNALALSPFLAEIAPDLGSSVAVVGQALTVSGIIGAILGLLIGSAAGALGYRRLLLGGAAALVLCDIGTALASSFGGLLLAQLFAALGGATLTPMAFAIAGSLYQGPARGRVISRIYASSSAVTIAGFPLLTAIERASSWRWSFVALAVAGAGSIVLAAKTLPADGPLTRPSLRLSTLLGAYGPLARHAPVALTFGAQFVRGVCWSGLLAYVGAFIVEALGHSVQLAGLAWTVIGPGFLVGSLLSGGRLRRYEPRLVFVSSVTTMGALIGAAFIWQPAIGVVFALLLVASFAGGVAEVTAATILASETTVAQGPTMVLHSAMLRFGSAGGALVGGALLASGGYAAIGAGLPLVALASAALAWRARRVRAVGLRQAEVVHD